MPANVSSKRDAIIFSVVEGAARRKAVTPGNVTPGCAAAIEGDPKNIAERLNITEPDSIGIH